MRLTKLEVHGFKAFADHLEFVFERGVTAIVGPNGSGKSNVSDAVRWVLGEQRARAMRGAKMEDVIFHGSSARKAVNMAEVSLHFDNTEGELPIPFKEVVITRRLLRSGESEYLLNRAPCRLRDIQDLVRGTGLGADSGVVIESKMIDALLSDRPDDRRELFEEAAGVGLYRDRRRSAERRLEETTVDLARLDDLIAEVQSQVRSLARQRRRAERHAELTARRFQVEISLATREMAAWRDELEALDGRLIELRGDVPGAEEAIAAAELQREEAHMARSTAGASRLELAPRRRTAREDAEAERESPSPKSASAVPPCGGNVRKKSARRTRRLAVVCARIASAPRRIAPRSSRKCAMPARRCRSDSPPNRRRVRACSVNGPCSISWNGRCGNIGTRPVGWSSIGTAPRVSRWKPNSVVTRSISSGRRWWIRSKPSNGNCSPHVSR